jgi:hypothetical protein
MNHTLRKTIAGAVAATSLTLGFAATAYAQSTSTSPTRAAATQNTLADALRTRCLADIDGRLAEIDKLNAAIAAAKNLSPAHSSTLSNALSSAKSGLTALRATIAADSNDALRADCQRIFTDYRIYALRVPQVHIVIGGDRIAAELPKLTDAANRLADVVAQATKNGNPNAAQAKTLLDDMNAKLADATKQSTGIADSVVNLTPPDWNANHDVLKPAVAALRATGVDLHAAGSDAKQIVNLLKTGSTK